METSDAVFVDAAGANSAAREYQSGIGRMYRNALAQCAAPIAAGLLILLSAAAPASAACQMFQVAELNVTMENHTPIVRVLIDGHSVRMILSTSYTRTQLDRSAARNLHLKLRPSVIAFMAPMASPIRGYDQHQ